MFYPNQKNIFLLYFYIILSRYTFKTKLKNIKKESVKIMMINLFYKILELAKKI